MVVLPEAIDSHWRESFGVVLAVVTDGFKLDVAITVARLKQLYGERQLSGARVMAVAIRGSQSTRPGTAMMQARTAT